MAKALTGTRLREFREGRIGPSGGKMSQADFADLIGISKRALGNYEQGLADVPKSVALACAAVAHGLPPLE